jgi:hypothetical protein
MQPLKETMKTHNIGFDTSSSSTSYTTLVLFVMACQPNHEWILDSRSSHHMVNNKDFFSSLDVCTTQ